MGMWGGSGCAGNSGGILSALGSQWRVLVGRIGDGDKARLVELVPAGLIAGRVDVRPAHDLLANALLHLVDARRVGHVPAAAERCLAPLASDGHLSQ